MAKNINSIVKNGGEKLLEFIVEKDSLPQYMHFLKQQVNHYMNYLGKSYDSQKASFDAIRQLSGTHFRKTASEKIAKISNSEEDAFKNFDYELFMSSLQNHILFLLQNKNGLLQGLDKTVLKADRLVQEQQITPTMALDVVNDYIGPHYTYPQHPFSKIN